MEENLDKNIENNGEKNVDIKGTLANFLKDEEPELSQEEAIKKYSEYVKKRKSNTGGAEDNTEEEEHLKRVKQELLASLERVKKLEKQIYGQNEKEINAKKLKVKESGGGMQGSQSKENIVENNEKVKDQDLEK